MDEGSEASDITLSFTDGASEVDSVQFILKTPGISADEEVATEIEEEGKEPWYVELREKIKALFTYLFA